MPVTIKRLTSQGLQNVAHRAGSLNAAANSEPREGVYTVGKTYNISRTLLLDVHLDRLEESARCENIPLQCDRQRLRSALREMILAAGYGDVRFRISVAASAPDEMLLTIEPYEPPAALLLAKGVRCVTSSFGSRRNPTSKSSDWIHLRRSLRAAMPAGIYETFLLDERGNMLEGLSSNFFAILSGSLCTVGEGVLAGISRRIVLNICQNVLPLELRAPKQDEIAVFEEAFLTSSSRGIIPVVEIDGVPIGDGRVGSSTKVLRQLYESWVAAHLEEL